MNMAARTNPGIMPTLASGMMTKISVPSMSISAVRPGSRERSCHLRKRIQDFFNERIRAASRYCRILEHDPEKWIPVFGKIMPQNARGVAAATYTSIVAVTGT